MKLTHSIATFFLANLTATSFAAGIADQVTVVEPYVRVAPPGSKTTAAFMTIKNAGDKDIQIVKANSSAAGVTELHNHINDNGVMRMRQVKEVVVPAKGEAQLKPGGYHVMLIDVKSVLKAGDHVVINLGFADGSNKEIHAIAKMPTTEASGGMDHSKMKH